jgi:hypothetical protein
MTASFEERSDPESEFTTTQEVGLCRKHAAEIMRGLSDRAAPPDPN